MIPIDDMILKVFERFNGKGYEKTQTCNVFFNDKPLDDITPKLEVVYDGVTYYVMLRGSVRLSDIERLVDIRKLDDYLTIENKEIIREVLNLL